MAAMSLRRELGLARKTVFLKLFGSIRRKMAKLHVIMAFFKLLSF
jgi:hypothetical protein